MDILSVLINFLIAAVVSAIIIWVVSKLNLGLSVDGFAAAIIAAIVIALVSSVIYWLLGILGITIGGDLLGAIINLIIAAIVLMISDRFVPGMKVRGFTGALIAALAIAVITYLLNLIF